MAELNRDWLVAGGHTRRRKESNLNSTLHYKTLLYGHWSFPFPILSLISSLYSPSSASSSSLLSSHFILLRCVQIFTEIFLNFFSFTR